MRGCCLTTVQYQRVSVHLSHELKSPRGCLAQIKFQRVIIHLHPQKEERKKQSNYIEVPPRVSQITRRRHADGRGGTADASTSKCRGRGEFAKDAPEAC